MSELQGLKTSIFFDFTSILGPFLRPTSPQDRAYGAPLDLPGLSLCALKPFFLTFHENFQFCHRFARFLDPQNPPKINQKPIPKPCLHEAEKWGQSPPLLYRKINDLRVIVKRVLFKKTCKNTVFLHIFYDSTHLDETKKLLQNVQKTL